MHGCVPLLLAAFVACGSPNGTTGPTPPSPELVAVPVPVPIADPGPTKRLVIERPLGSATGRVTLGERLWDKGTSYREWTIGHGLERRKVSITHSDDEYQDSSVQLRAIAGNRRIGGGWHRRIYVGNRYVVELEVETKPGRCRLLGWVLFFPRDGVAVGVGWGPTAWTPSVRVELCADEWTELPEKLASLTAREVLTAFLIDLFR